MIQTPTLNLEKYELDDMANLTDGYNRSMDLLDGYAANNNARFPITSENIADGTITAVDIANGAITTNKISDAAITESKLADGSVSASKVQDEAITGEKIAPESITNDKMSPEFVFELADNSVSTAKLQDGAVTGDKIAVGAIGSNAIADGAITGDKIAAGSITNDMLAGDFDFNIADGSVTTTKIADNAVTNEKLAEDSVSAINIVDGEIGDAQIGDHSIQIDKINPAAFDAVPTENSGNLVNSGGIFNAIKNFTPAPASTNNIVCIGDSWLEGYTSVGNTTSWGVFLSALANSPEHIFYKGGSGFVVASGGKTFATLIQESVVDNPETVTHVVIAGGINDRNATASQINSGVNAVLNAANAKYPNAKICIIPMMLSGRYLGDLSINTLNNILNAASQSTIPNYTCSVAWSWIYDNTVYHADSMHPTEAGQKRVANFMFDFITNGNEHYIESHYVTPTGGLASQRSAWRTGRTLHTKFVNSGTLNDTQSIIMVPERYKPYGQYFTSYLEGSQGQQMPCNTTTSGGNTSLNIAYRSSVSQYGNTTWPINDNE